jgi:hypothetical protein
MMRRYRSSLLIDASDWLYQLLLGAYPREFRQEYASQMAQVFHDCAARRTGSAGRSA